MIDVALLILRVVVGAVFIAHGSQKLFGAFGGDGIEGTAQMFAQMGMKPGRVMALLAGISEFGGGFLVLLGLLTPLGAIAIIGAMLVAIVKVHAPNGFFSQNGGYEYNLTLIGIAAALIIAGSGAYSLDGALGIL